MVSIYVICDIGLLVIVIFCCCVVICRLIDYLAKDICI